MLLIGGNLLRSKYVELVVAMRERGVGRVDENGLGGTGSLLYSMDDMDCWIACVFVVWMDGWVELRISFQVLQGIIWSGGENVLLLCGGLADFLLNQDDLR